MEMVGNSYGQLGEAKMPLSEAQTELQSYMQSTQTRSEGIRAKKWKLQSDFFYEDHPILSCLNLQ